MTDKNIAFVIPSLHSGGAERVVSNLANFLTKDYQIHIITLSKTEPFYILDERVILHHCVERIEPSSTILDAIKSNKVLISRIIKICRENQIKLLIGFMTTANVLSIISSKILGISTIISERNNPKKDKTPKIWRMLRKLTYRFAEHIVVQTEPIKQFYIKTIDEFQLSIIPNPVYMNSKSPENISDNENIILNVGRLSYQKAQDILIKAFAKTNNEEWKMIIVGEGEDRLKLESLISELNFQNKVELLGSVKDISAIYTKAKIFAFSSRYEGFPNALIEAMYFGLPCISTACPTGPSELIENGINGFLSPVDEIDKFAEKLNILMQNENLRLDFGNKSREAVVQFDISVISKQWKQLIDNYI